MVEFWLTSWETFGAALSMDENCEVTSSGEDLSLSASISVFSFNAIKANNKQRRRYQGKV